MFTVDNMLSVDNTFTVENIFTVESMLTVDNMFTEENMLTVKNIFIVVFGGENFSYFPEGYHNYILLVRITRLYYRISYLL